MKLLPATVFLLGLSLLGCQATPEPVGAGDLVPTAPVVPSDPVGPNAPKPVANVVGVVTGTPFERMPSPLDGAPSPGARIPPPAAGQRIVLRAWLDDGAVAGPIVAEARSDEQGQFKLAVAPGKYFLCVVESDLKWAITTLGEGAARFHESERVNDVVVIEVPAEGGVTEDLHISQAWPV